MTDAKKVSATDGLREQVEATGNIPRHLAIIMDGNGRWARKRFLPRVAGHRAARDSVRRTVRICAEIGIEYLTLYTFSQENWKRPASEVNALWAFLDEVITSECTELDGQNVRMIVSGEIDLIPAKARSAMNRTVTVLSKNTGMVLNLALAYGGRTEVLRAVRRLAQKAIDGEIVPADIDETAFTKELYNPSIPDPDLVIRTSGEYRLSNFLIWQAAYAEMVFSPTLWPDFNEGDLLAAVADYQGRERRFGDIGKEQAVFTNTHKRLSLFDPSRWKSLLKVR